MNMVDAEGLQAQEELAQGMLQAQAGGAGNPGPGTELASSSTARPRDAGAAAAAPAVDTPAADASPEARLSSDSRLRRYPVSERNRAERERRRQQLRQQLSAERDDGRGSERLPADSPTDGDGQRLVQQPRSPPAQTIEIPPGFLPGDFAELRPRGSHGSMEAAMLISLLPCESWGYHYIREEDNGQGDHECRVCLCEYESGDDLIRLPCMHFAHARCMEEWLSRSGKCPVCRSSVREGLQVDDMY